MTTTKIQTINNQPFLDGRGLGFYDVFSAANLPGQFNVSELQPGMIRGFHWHENQTDYVFCPKGNMHVILVQGEKRKYRNGDLEKQFYSFDGDDIKHFYIGEKNPQTLVIPPGVLHGYQTLYNQPATMCYYTDKKYDLSDEHRVDWDYYGKEIWEHKHG